MEKLIHERLREIANNRWLASLDVDESSSRDAIDIVRESLSYVKESMSYCVDMQNILNYIADEIEKYYDPKLRFEDGEPAKEGDKYVDQYGHECTISSIDKRARIWDENGGYEVVDVCKPLKRPKSKVLDADGIEIKVGDTVWVKNSPFEPLLVSGFKDGRVLMSYHNDTSLGYKPTSLTHREPDSLEKLRDDLRDLVPFMPADELTVNTSDLISIANRLTAMSVMRNG